MSEFNLQPAMTPQDAVVSLQHKLALYADAWDLAEDISQGNNGIMVLDVRSTELYQKQHITTAVSFPHRTMNAETLAMLDPALLYITYCDGIGCNGSTKGALKLALAGFHVRELIGGLDFWLRDKHAVTEGIERGEWPGQENSPGCGC